MVGDHTIARFTEIKTILYGDDYMIRRYKEDDFDYIIDIGGNAGTFTLVSHILFPGALIFTYEPCKSTFAVMCENLKKFRNIKLINKALGSGNSIFIRDVWYSTSRAIQFIEEDTGNYKIDSSTMVDIFKDNDVDINKNILVKMDCEGGEEILLDNESNEILKKCKQISMEIHFKCPGNSYFDNFPEWKVYNSWVYDVFEETHDILYHKSSKHKGTGIYVITLKESVA